MSFIELTEYDGYRMSPNKTRINPDDIVKYVESRAESFTYVMIRGCNEDLRVCESASRIDKLIEQSRQLAQTPRAADGIETTGEGK